MKSIAIVSLLFLCFLRGHLCQAQDRADFDICGKNGVCGGIICIGPADTTYLVTIKIKQLPTTCPVTKYEVDWGDGKSEVFTDVSVLERTHAYDLKGFLRDCGSETKRFPIFVYPNCPNSDKGVNLTFNKTPVAAISTGGDVCEGQNIRLKNTSCPGSGSDVTWQWDLGNGQTSTAFEPTLDNLNLANSPYTFSLTATSVACGASKAQITVPIKKKPVAQYTTQGLTILNQDTVVCLDGGGVLTMDATISLNADSYRWTVTGGPYTFINNTNARSAKPQIKFSQSGSYVITLVVENGCGTSAPLPCPHKVVDKTNLALPKLDFICEQPYLYKIPNPVAGATYTLNGQAFNPTTGVSLSYSATPVVVEARLQGPCGLQVDRDTFMVNAPQMAQILTKDTTVCINSPAFGIKASLPGGQWTGTNVNKQTGVFTPSTAGTFTIQYALGTGLCASMAEFKITVVDAKATATHVEVCQGTPAIKLLGSPAGGQWTTTQCNNCIRGDSLILTGITATSLTLMYEVSSSAGCKATAQATVSIGQPRASFTIQGGCSGTQPQISNDSQGASSYRWYVNGRLESDTKIPALVNLPAGKLTISLVALAGTCRDSTTREVEITSAPGSIAFDIQSTSTCSPLRATFQVKGIQRSDVTYSWDFEDGNPFAGFQPPPRTFENTTRQTKTFTVRVKAENGCGIETATQTLTVRPLAKAELGVDSTVVRCSPGKITFSNRSTGHEANRSLWFFGDGAAPFQSAKDTLIREFAASDTIRTYRIRLVVFSTCGSDTDEVFIRVIPNTIKPLFTLSQSEACPGEPVQFLDATTPKATGWVWKFGTEDISNLQNPTHAFAKANTTYLVTLIAYTGCGYDSVQHSIKITELPKADFDIPVPYGCIGQAIKLANKSDPRLAFLWDFGDGTRDSTHFNPSHSYQSGSSKSIMLTVFGSTRLCKTEIKKSVFIQPKVEAQFSVENGAKICSPGPVQLRSLAQNATRYYWTFSDGQVSGAENPLVSFRPGRYDVKFKATYEDVCADSTVQIGSIVVDSCEVLIPQAFTPNGDGMGDLYTVFGSGIERVEFMRIRKRTGEILFETKDVPPGSQNPTEAWDGTFQNVLMPNDMYALEVLIRYSDGNKKNYASDIYLIR
jgi:gliding motility-associated-like protein